MHTKGGDDVKEYTEKTKNHGVFASMFKKKPTQREVIVQNMDSVVADHP